MHLINPSRNATKTGSNEPELLVGVGLLPAAASSQRRRDDGHTRKKSSVAVSASTASGMPWRCERMRSSTVWVACR